MKKFNKHKGENKYFYNILIIIFIIVIFAVLYWIDVNDYMSTKFNKKLVNLNFDFWSNIIYIVVPIMITFLIRYFDIKKDQQNNFKIFVINEWTKLEFLNCIYSSAELDNFFRSKTNTYYININKYTEKDISNEILRYNVIMKKIGLKNRLDRMDFCYNNGLYKSKKILISIKMPDSNCLLIEKEIPFYYYDIMGDIVCKEGNEILNILKYTISVLEKTTIFLKDLEEKNLIVEDTLNLKICTVKTKLNSFNSEFETYNEKGLLLDYINNFIIFIYNGVNSNLDNFDYRKAFPYLKIYQMLSLVLFDKNLDIVDIMEIDETYIQRISFIYSKDEYSTPLRLWSCSRDCLNKLKEANDYIEKQYW